MGTAEPVKAPRTPDRAGHRRRPGPELRRRVARAGPDAAEEHADRRPSAPVACLPGARAPGRDQSRGTWSNANRQLGEVGGAARSVRLFLWPGRDSFSASEKFRGAEQGWFRRARVDLPTTQIASSATRSEEEGCDRSYVFSSFWRTNHRSEGPLLPCVKALIDLEPRRHRLVWLHSCPRLVKEVHSLSVRPMCRSVD
jgi:hypothetical protein